MCEILTKTIRGHYSSVRQFGNSYVAFMMRNDISANDWLKYDRTEE